MKVYDVVVIGAGASGLTTALYTARANLKTLVIEKGIYGGQLQNTAEIENYSGFSHISGADLSDHMYNQAIEHGVEYAYGEVEAIKYDRWRTHYIRLKSGEVIRALSVVIATGVKHRKLGIHGEEKLSGKGVSYCAICDGAFFKDQKVVVIGGGDSALEEANYLANIASEVTIIHRGTKFRGQEILQQRVFDNPKIRVRFNSQVKGVVGEDKVVGVYVIDNDNEKWASALPTDGVFIYIGLDPVTEPFESLGIVNKNGYIITNESMYTGVEGIFAVGDVRDKSVRQIATAVGDGAIAGVEIKNYLDSLDKSNR